MIEGTIGEAEQSTGEYCRCKMRAKTAMMTNGIIHADTSERTIKNGTSKDAGGERKIGVRRGGQVRGMSDGS